MKTEKYDETYFERGIQSGVSGYDNYRWMPELTIRMAHHVAGFLNLSEKTTLLDYGCAKGYLVKAFRILDIPAFGCDVSRYAIAQCPPDVRGFCRLVTGNTIPFDDVFDTILAKDVLEHLTEPEIDSFLQAASTRCRRLFHVTPLGDGSRYVIPQYEADVTHIQRQSAAWWVRKFEQFGFSSVSVSTEMKGVKENWTRNYRQGNGFSLAANSNLSA